MYAIKFGKKTLVILHTNCIFDALELLMKHIFLFLGLLICSTPAFSQTKNVTISWENEISRPSFVSPTSPLVNSTAVKKSSKQICHYDEKHYCRSRNLRLHSSLGRLDRHQEPAH